MFETRLARRIFKSFAILAISGVLGVGALLGLLWREHRTEVTLPTPTGSFAVGRATYAWADDVASDRLAPVPGAKRELVVWIWYPSAAGQSAATRDDYLSAPLRTEVERARGALVSKFLTRDLSQVRAHSSRNADVSPAGWKKFERAWDLVIRIKQLSQMRPLLEAVLAPVPSSRTDGAQEGLPNKRAVCR